MLLLRIVKKADEDDSRIISNSKIIKECEIRFEVRSLKNGS